MWPSGKVGVHIKVMQDKVQKWVAMGKEGEATALIYVVPTGSSALATYWICGHQSHCAVETSQWIFAKQMAPEGVYGRADQVGFKRNTRYGPRFLRS
jgi:hypothetical protein